MKLFKQQSITPDLTIRGGSVEYKGKVIGLTEARKGRRVIILFTEPEDLRGFTEAEVRDIRTSLPKIEDDLREKGIPFCYEPWPGRRGI